LMLKKKTSLRGAQRRSDARRDCLVNTFSASFFCHEPVRRVFHSRTPLKRNLPVAPLVAIAPRMHSYSHSSSVILSFYASKESPSLSSSRRSEEARRLLAEDLARGDDVREGAPGGDIDDGETGGVARLHAGALRLDHLAVRIGAAVVLVHGGREAEAAREKARRGVDAHDLLNAMGANAIGVNGEGQRCASCV
jgi:hypothetical protein